MGKEPSLADRFACETGIHGLRALLDSRNIVERAIWFLIVGTATGFMVRGVWFTFVQFQRQPKTTKVDIGMPGDFPPVLACPTHWVSASKLAEHGFTTDDQEALARVFMTAADFVNSDVHEYMIEHHAHFREKMEDLDWTIDDMIGELAIDVEELLKDVYMTDGVGKYLVDNATTITTRGPCVLLQPQEGLDEFSADSLTLVAVIKQPDWESAYELESDFEPGLKVYIGDQALSMRPVEEIPVVPCMSSDIKVSATGIIRANSDQWSDYCDPLVSDDEEINCKLESLNSLCEDQGWKPFYLPDRGDTVDEVSTHLLDEPASTKCKTEKVIYYHEDCVKACSKWVYHASVMPVRTSCREGGDIIKVSLQNPQNSIVFREQYTETIDQFMSNLGGQIALYSGASLVTVLHIVMFCIFQSSRKKPTRSETDITKVDPY